jgi:dUTP pyrophosphatase
MQQDDIWSKIQETFDNIKKETGIEPDDDNMAELEKLLGFSVEELNDEHLKFIKTKIVSVELLFEDTKVPSYVYPTDSGFDLYSRIDLELPAFGRGLVPTGLKLSIPDEYEIQIRPKSGLAINMGLTVLNTPGTVDSGYDGEVKVIIYNSTHDTVYIEKGQKIAQACICPVVNGKWINPVEVSEISGKDRGDNGFGSTGIK